MSLIQDIISRVEAHTGKAHELLGQQTVGGGCINQTQRIDTNQGAYFLKLNTADRLDMFEAEAEGLQAMNEAGAVAVPTPLCSGVSGGHAWLVMEYIEGGGRGSMAEFGEQLAAMHRFTKDRFGWHRDNTIGSTHQANDWNSDWVSFWQQQRLGFQLELARTNGAPRRLCEQGQKLNECIGEFFTDYSPVASVLHGDLWSGNYMMGRDGRAVIYDPAVYFGDREADLAMTELFGSFGRDFHAGYNAAWPLDEGYAARKTLYNLYHILNHYNLFGGGYAGQAQGMIERCLAEIG